MIKKGFTEDPLLTKVQFIKGVGPRLSSVFAARSIGTVRDLLYFFPRKYEDRSKLSLIKDLTEGCTASLELTVHQAYLRPLRGKFSKLLEVKAKDQELQWMSLKWFRMFKGFETKFIPGNKIIATGQVKIFGSIREMVHPDIQFDLTEDLHVGRVIPVYTEIDGVPTKTLRKIIDTALSLAGNEIKEELPPSLLQKHGLPQLAKAIREVHFPNENYNFEEFKSPAQQRLIYEEFFKFEYHVLSQRMRLEKEKGHTLKQKALEESFQHWLKKLPFTLTAGQQQSMDDIMGDFIKPHPMNRLLQGDVGAGKTAVALLSALSIMDQGFQSAIMAPTEILADQHYQNVLKIFGSTIPVKLLVGKTSTVERRSIQALLDSDSPALIIGTHALIEDPVKFRNLGLVIIDEQHRFGVDQRRKLREKSVIQPHTLIMTATPIPRTLALTAYGDLAVSIIRERPPGRTPIKTHLVRLHEYEKMIIFIKKNLSEGRQAYFIFPLVNDSEEEGFTHLKSAVTAAETLANDTFPEFKIGLLHGQLSSSEKAAIMDRFRRNEVQILVSTTVVEVGVDVPNATVMVIEHPERFGLSQLHQLRGRIGRGQHASTCFLKTDRPAGQPTPERLEVMVETEDGFKIAEADLELRGPGEFLGTRQSGALPFKMASLVRDQDWLIKARADVEHLLESDPELKTADNAPFKKYLENAGKREASHFKTS
ncbi:MAG: ATP-dependent DNA helicase RecG [Bdellovibrionales bacterium]|nr:ATP-dependent DNA helicase RecG [Oligoflexia bacterium]